MASEDGSNGVRCGDTEGRCFTFIASSLHETAELKAGRPMQEIKSFVVFAAVLICTFLIANDKMLCYKL